jgi:hypothetical protein
MCCGQNKIAEILIAARQTVAPKSDDRLAEMPTLPGIYVTLNLNPY